MASRRELERLEDENRTLCQRLSDTEVELVRKTDALKAANTRNAELLSDFREYQHKVKELKASVERAEIAELEAKGAAQDAKIAQERSEAALRDQSASSKAAITNLQVEIKSLKLRLIEKEEACEASAAQLYRQEEQLSTVQGEKARMDREGSSRVANLNQALMKAKQMCAQLATEKESLLQSQKEAAEKFESLEQKFRVLEIKKVEPCVECRERESQIHVALRTPQRAPCTPVKPIPEETELDSLQIENAKLKQDLQCLQANFHLTSVKCTNMKKQIKEAEQSLTELQSAHDQLLGEREELKQSCKEIQVALINKSSAEKLDRERGVTLERENTSLQSQLEKLQQQNTNLQDKLKTEIARQLVCQDTTDMLDAETRSLRQDKKGLESELTAASEKLEAVKFELASHLASVTDHSEVKRRSSEAINAYKCKIAHFSAEKKVMEEQLHEASQLVNSLQSQSSTLKETNASQRSTIARLEIELRHVKQQFSEQTSSSDVEKSLRGQLVKLSDDLKLLSEEHKELEKAQSRSECHAQQITKEKVKASREASHNWELARKLQKELEKHEETCLGLKEELQASQELCSNQAKKVESLKLELSSVGKAKKVYEMEVSKLMDKMEDLEQHNFELSSRLADARSKTDSAEVTQVKVHSKLDSLEKRLLDRESALTEKESQIRALQNSNELMERENSTLLSQVNSLSEMVAARNVKIDTLQEQISHHDLETREIAVRVMELESNHGQCTQTKAQLEEEIQALKKTSEAADIFKKEAENSILSLRLELKQLQEYNSSLESINAGLQRKIKSLITRSEELSSSSQFTEQSLHEIKQELKQKTASLNAALSELESVRKSSEDALATLKSKCETLESRCNTIRDDYEEMRCDKMDVSARAAQLQLKLAEQCHAYSEMERVKKHLEEKFEKTQTEVAAIKDRLYTTEQEMEAAKCDTRRQKELLTRKAQEDSLTVEELKQILEQFERQRESALSVLEYSDPNSTENSPVSMPTKKKLRGILKTTSPHPKSSALRQLQNLT